MIPLPHRMVNVQVTDVLGRRVLFSIGETPVTVATLVTSGLILLAALIVGRLIRRVLERIIERRTDPQSRGNLLTSVRLLQYFVVITGLLVALHTLGVALTGLFAAGALFAVAIGFAMQNVTANFISGVILLMERSIKPGDIVEVNGQMCKIKEMGIRAAIARTLGEEDLIIPSSQFVQSTVRNFTLRDSLTRIRVLVGVTYGSDMALVRSTLEKAADELDWRSRSKAPQVYMKEFGSSSVNFEISVWFDDPWRRQQRNSDVHEAIWWALKNAGVTIAFPQLDVHFDPDTVEAWQERSK